MARLVVKCGFIRPGKHAGNYVKYIATREGVEILDDRRRLAPATKKQEALISQLLQDFPDAKEMLEYEDYLQNRTIGNASEFITRALEDNAGDIVSGKTYADYIATRPGAERFGRHGLFTDAGVDVDLDRVSAALNQYSGNVWTVIASLRREDAARLGFDEGRRWRDMLRTQVQTLSESVKIPIEHLHWYAAFHNAAHHPHVHMILYSDKPGEGYLTKQGLKQLKSSLAQDIFAQDLHCVYARQTQYRDDLRQSVKARAAEIAEQIEHGSCEDPQLETLLLQLSRELPHSSGRKVYAYLQPEVKKLVDRIVDRLAQDERIAGLYGLWYEQREAVLQVYRSSLPPRVSLAECPEFRPIKNAVIQEALALQHLRSEAAPEAVRPDTGPSSACRPLPEAGGVPSGEDVTSDGDAPYAPPDEDAPFSPAMPPKPEDLSSAALAELFPDSPEPDIPVSGQKKDTWWSDRYKAARVCLYGTLEQPDFEKAYALLREEAQSGNGFAMYDAGRMHLLGLGMDKDEARAQDWFRKACQAFLSKAASSRKNDYLQYRIGKLYSFGHGVEQDHSKAAEWFAKAVDAGNPFAAYALGSLYRRGEGVEQNDEKAFALYRMAAEHKSKANAYAMYELGRMYQDGTGTEQDAAGIWFQRAYLGFLAMERNMPDDRLYYRLGRMNLSGTGTEKDLHAAHNYFVEAEKLGNVDAMYGLGILYLTPEFDGQDMQKAAEHLTKAAEQGHAYAQYALGKLYLKGEGIPQDTARGICWLEKAVRQENTAAQYLLGKYLLLSGEIPQDLPRGLTLLRASADKGFTPAEYLLGKQLYRGEVVNKDIAKALSYLDRASSKGDPYAAYLSGMIRLREPDWLDVSEAVHWLEASAAGGSDHAEYQLGRLYLSGKLVERDVEKALSWLHASAEHGNPYAQQLLEHMQDQQMIATGFGVLRLFHHAGRLIQNQIGEDRQNWARKVDRKLRQKVAEKKQAQGLHLE